MQEQSPKMIASIEIGKQAITNNLAEVIQDMIKRLDGVYDVEIHLIAHTTLN